MLSSLTDTVRNVASSIRSIGKYAAVSAVGLASLYMTSDSYAQNSKENTRTPIARESAPFWSPQRVEEIKRNRKITGGKYIESNVAGVPNTIIVSADWSETEVNNLMDNNSSTKGKGGIDDPLPYSGDTILFTTGTYQTFPDSNASFRNYIPGIIIQGQTGTYMQNDPNFIDGAVFRNNAIDVVINGIEFRNSRLGITNISPNLNPANPNYVTGVKFKNLQKTTSLNNVIVEGANNSPSVIEDSNEYDTITLGSIHNNSGPATSTQTAFNQFSNNTGRGVTALWYGPVMFFTTTAGGPFYLGPSLADGNAMLGSNGVFMPQEAYGPGASTATSNTAGTDIPDAN